MRVQVLDALWIERWQKFVDAHAAEATAHRDVAWHAILGDCFDVTPYFLMAVDDKDEVQGVLPMYSSRSFFTKGHLTTLEGGALCAHPDAAETLYREAFRLRDELGLNYVLARGGALPKAPAGASKETLHTRVSTGTGAAELWSSLNKKTRWGVRQAEKEGFQVVRNDAAVEEFYAVYAEVMRDLGTPVMSARFMTAMRRRLGGKFCLYVLQHGEQVVGGMIVIKTASIWFDQHAAVARRFQDLYGNYLLYWRVASEACACPRVVGFDLGRSAIGGGVHRFKQKWRGQDRLIQYKFYFAADARISLADRVVKDKMTLKGRVWTHLPLVVANRVGPWLRKQLPFG